MNEIRTQIAAIHSVSDLRAQIESWRRDGARIALIPTMGALHQGHLALAAAARARGCKIMLSIFVNPTQFAPHEDFARYPRDLERDRAMLESFAAADLIYAPGVTEIYPEGFATQVLVRGPAMGLETDYRPHFFGGVATVVAKLLLQCLPDIVFFGEKDYQQLLVVKRLAKDLDLKIEVAGVPTVREADGLALSSRNAYLTPEQRAIASSLNVILRAVATRAKSGISIPQAEAEGAAQLLNAGFDRVDYVAIRDAETLSQLRDVRNPARVLAAAYTGKVRLIDNFSV